MSSFLGQSAADGRDFSLHMLVHVPKQCVLTRSTGKIVLYGLAGNDQALRFGQGKIHIVCNSLYAVNVRRVGGSARAIGSGDHPIRAASKSMDRRYGVALTSNGVGGALDAHCRSLADVQRDFDCVHRGFASKSDAARPSTVASLKITSWRTAASMNDAAPQPRATFLQREVDTSRSETFSFEVSPRI